jgi:6,7-dimethyl-8-ribityllumazine synthase
MSRRAPKPIPGKTSPSWRFAVIAARFNEKIVDELLRRCITRLGESRVPGKNIRIFRVPGAFELPVAAKLAAESGKFAAVICLGAVIRGDTPHFDFVAGEAARGIQQVALDTGIPIIFGVLTTNTEKQAVERLTAAARAADAAIEMAQLAHTIAARRL